MNFLKKPKSKNEITDIIDDLQLHTLFYLITCI